MALAASQNEAPNPVDVLFLRAIAVMLRSNPSTHSLEKLPLGIHAA